jgi:hypothetical protein
MLNYTLQLKFKVELIFTYNKVVMSN